MDPTRRNDHLSSARRHLAGDNHRAFTLVELLVVLGTVAILTVLLLPALASTQPASAKAFQCLNNMRQMAVAWTIYAGDNHDQLVLNTDLYRISGGKGGNPSWCQGIEDWSTSTINTNTLALTTDPVSLLAPYTAHRYQIYHCPADRYVSPVQAARGWPYRVRSVSMSCAIGDGGSGPGGGRAPEFPWAAKILKTKLTDLRVPGPGEVWVFLDEAPDSINDPMFYNNPDATGALDGTANGGNWIDFPSSLHDGGGTFSFADGHAGLHRWLDTNTRATAAVKYTAGVATPGSAPVDVAWLSAHTPLP